MLEPAPGSETRVPCQNPRGGLTCCSALGAHAHPPCLYAHGPGVRLAGPPGAERR